MKYKVFFIIFLFISTLSSINCSVGRIDTPHRAGQRDMVDVGFFYDELAPYGRWFRVDDYGWVWTPYGVSVGWRPYTRGHWVYTDYGWTWVSDWRWGWAPFHYGRWTHHRTHGWMWIPGTVWGPSWVVWRHHPGWVGWAPLPPHAGWQDGAGLNLRGFDLDAVVEPDWYSFVREENLLAPNLDRHFEQTSRNAALIRESRRITDYDATNHRVVNRGVDVEQLEKTTRKAIKRQRVIETGSANEQKVRGDEIVVFKPKIAETTTTRTPPNTQEQTPNRQEKENRKLEQQKTEERLNQENQQRKLEQQQAEEKAKLKKQQRKLENQQAEERAKQEKQQRKLEQQKAEERARVEQQQTEEKAKLEKQQRKEQKRIEQQAEEARQQAEQERRKQEKQERKKKKP
jgi:hypothetical protein